MSDLFITRLTQQLQAALPTHRIYPITELDRLGLPEAIKVQLRYMAAARLEAALPALDEAWFDVHAPAVREAYQTLCARLLQHGRLPAELWLTLLRQSVAQVVAYLSQPIHTLVQHVFGDEHAPLPSERIVERLQAFAPYAYFREAITLYLQQKPTPALERDRFRAILQQVDRQFTADFDAQAWIRLLEPLYELASLLPERPAVVPLPLLITFFSEKQQSALISRLQHLASQGLQALSADALHDVLVQEQRAPTTPIPSAVTAEEPVPLWRRFQLQQARVVVEAPAPSSSALPRWMQFYQKPPTTPSTELSLEAIENAVLGSEGSRNRELFIKALFGGNPVAYTQVLRQLYHASTWAEASQIIAQEVFRRYQVNIYSEPAVSFTEAVERRYRNR